MGKTKSNCGVVAVWARQRGAQKTHVSLAFICIFMLGSDSPSLAATSCSETCIVTTSTYVARVQNSTGWHYWWHYDLGSGCDPITEKYTTYLYTPGMVKYLIYRPTKSYWDVSSRSWRNISTAQYGTYAPELPAGIYWGGSAEQLFPNGCSDIPSQQPDQAPNLDPGKPDCPQVPLN